MTRSGHIPTLSFSPKQQFSNIWSGEPFALLKNVEDPEELWFRQSRFAEREVRRDVWYLM